MRQLCRGVFGACVLAWLVSVGAAGSAAAVVSPAGARPFLLDTVEFRGIPLGGWYDFPDKVAEALDVLSRCAGSPAGCPRRDVAALLAETARLAGHEPFQVLTAVNRLVNRRPYRSDPANYGASEYWASPLEFLARSGDCEDFAIFKYVLLRHLGVPAESLRIVLMKRKADGVGHAVLAAYLDDRVFILDSAAGQVRPQSEVTEYTAVFSFNENARWAHIQTEQAADPRPKASKPDRVANRERAGPEGVDWRRLAPADSALFLQLYNAVFSSAGPEPGEYRVQLGAFRSLENANELWQRVWRAEWDLLGQREPWIHSVGRGETGPLHLLQIGALASARQAQSLCQALSERGLDCFVVRPGGRGEATGRT